MLSKYRAPTETLTTLSTMVRFVSHVDLEMVKEACFLAEGFAALVTLVVLLSCVKSLMLVKS